MGSSEAPGGAGGGIAGLARRWLLAAALPLLAAPLPAAELASGGGRIKGSVTGAGRRDLVGAHVVARIALPDRDALFITTTDESGSYLYESLPPGRYELRAQAAGHLEGSYREVEVQPPFRNILDFRLRPLEGEDGAATGAEKEAPADGEVPAALASGPAPSGEAVPLAGRITGPAGRPVADAEIAFSGGPPPGQRLVLSTGDGRFGLPDLDPGLYTLEVTAPGTIPIRIPAVAVTAGRPLEMQVRLADFPLEMAAKRGIILPPEEPLPPRRWLEIPPAPPAESSPQAPRDPPAE